MFYSTEETVFNLAGMKSFVQGVPAKPVGLIDKPVRAK